MSESRFNFSGSSSLSSPTTSSLLSPATDRVEDPPILSPLQNTSLGLLSGTQQSFASYPPQNSMNQVNGAYMQDSQVVYLQDRCKTLEQHLVKVTSKRDTVRNLFDQLTNALKSMSCGPGLLDASAPLPALTVTDEKAPTRESHPNVRFWTKKDFDDWLESAEAEGSNRGIYAYLEDTNGNVPSSETLANMRKTLRGAWRELGQRNTAPETWGKASTSARQFVRSIMETTFPLFKFAENGWKLEYICTRGYPAWSKCYLDDDGKLKRATRDAMKEEALDDADEDLQDHKPSKKRRGQTELEALHNKKAKVDDMAAAEPPEVAALGNGQPATTPAEILATQLNPPELFTAPDNKENIPVVNHADVTQPPVSYNPMSLLAAAAAKVKTSPVPPIPDSPVERESVPPCVSQAEDASKKKFRPSGTKNGRNLCILRWLKRVNPNSKKEEFRFYYDKTLTATQCEEYDKEAKQLVQDNTWVKAVIENGNLH
ncbi:hypothetical protein M404DRAFT_24516 [Pisolithus tinctorius Marx 270]|uniref:Uncharacterized protein n=1 Tax=Pisolithus tinctorius Marx 270 TaxID=870435 RepID=A0A0C3KB63_PISTI|nr:hypothetical protein M404DRAFT_24516 [Pisolithus tinctorius Marx 270]